MSDVKGISTRANRRERAARTRNRILDVAQRMFLARGYEATTMQAIADDAGVAVQTVYFTFGTKAGLVAELEARVVLGDQPPDRWPEQPWALQMRQEVDPAALIELFVTVNAEIVGRISSLVTAIGPALPTDSASVVARERGRDEFFGLVVDRLAALGALREGLSPARALDIIRVVVTIEGYDDLTRRRGWTVDEWNTWSTELLRQQLLRSPSAIQTP